MTDQETVDAWEARRRSSSAPNSAHLFGNGSARARDITPVGLAGFEPATSATQTRRASQTALQPVPTRV